MSESNKKEIIELLEQSILGEITTRCKYLHFADKAEEEDYLIISKLFKAVACAEHIHYNNFLNALAALKDEEILPDKYFHFNLTDIKKQVNNSNINLLNARVTESFEFNQKYKNSYMKAVKYGAPLIMKSVEYARLAEKSHANLFSSFIKDLNNNNLVDQDFKICINCGNVVLINTPEACGICNENSNTFKKCSEITNTIPKCLNIE